MSFFGDPLRVKSGFLSGAESGMVALAAGDWKAAQEQLTLAAEATSELEQRALAGTEELGEALASWVINDTQQSYVGEGFERVYIHCGLAMAYLAQGLVDDVYVEARLANQLLEAEEKLYEKSYAAGGWGHLISALAYELARQPQDAYLDYARMEAKGVGTDLALGEMRRLADQLGRKDELERLREAYGEWQPRPRDEARVVLLAGVGLAPFKYEKGLVLGTGDGIIKIVGPAYRARPQAIGSLVLRSGDQEVETVIVEDVLQVAEANLSDRLAWSVAKSAVRTFAKRELTQHLEDQYGQLGSLAGNIFSLVSERADLRSWLTLPDSWQAASMSMSAGVRDLQIEAVGGQIIDLGRYELEPGELLVVLVRTLGTRVYAYPIGGRSLESHLGEQP